MIRIARSLWHGDLRFVAQLDDPEQPTERVSMAAILALVAVKHDLTVHELRGVGRARRVSRPRQEAMALMHATGLFSLPQIGMFLGDRDHTTVLHGVRAHTARTIAADPELATWAA